jgi:gluconolactonase
MTYKAFFFQWALLLIFMPYSKAQNALLPLTTGGVVYKDPALEKLIPRSATIEVIGSGFQHIEGPVWVKDSSMLLFSDTKGQIIYRWSEEKGLSKFLTNVGFTGRLPYGEESGSNGLAIKNGELLLCEHGDRRISSYPLNGKYGQRTLIDNSNGKRLNSPNDVVVKSDGSIYFTDPSYGLPKKEADSTKEIVYNGVYKAGADGKATAIITDIAAPNGLAFSPDEKLLYISNSEQSNPQIWVFPVLPNGNVGKGKLFFDGKTLPAVNEKEVMDGLKTDKAGNVWACGRGGISIITPDGKLLGNISTGEIMANCAWGGDGTTLYIAAGYFLYRIKTNAAGNF